MTEEGDKLRQQVENDLSIFLKRVRQREEEHHRLCDYTNRLLVRQQQLEQIIYIHDEITKHANFHQQCTIADSAHKEADSELAEKCDSVLNQEQQGVLGRRVISRVLEITFAAIQTFREFREYYSAGYFRFKERCLKVISEGSNKTSSAVRMTSRYLNLKTHIQLTRLKQTMSCLETNDYQLFPHLKSTYYEIFPKNEMIQQKEENRPAISSQRTLFKQEESRPVNPEREVRNEIRVRAKGKSTREDKERARRAHTKKMKKLAAQLTEVMDVDRDELLDDLGPENKDWIQKRILAFLVTRNKNNQNLISTFLVREPYFKEATSRPPPKHFKLIQRCHSLEEEFLEQDESDSQEDQFKKNAFTVKDIHISENYLPKKEPLTAHRYDRRESMKAPLSSHNNPQRKQRVTLNNIEDLDRKRKEIFNSQKQIGQQDSLVEIQLKGTLRLPKARFPEIAHRAASVSKSKLPRVEESPLRTKLEIKPSTTYFEEVEKRIVKFCEMKRNLMV